MNKPLKKILLATDHAGFAFKEKTKEILQSSGCDFEDMGAFELNEKDDYPDFVAAAAKKISSQPDKYIGIIFGGSGQGEAIVANRFQNVRAVVYYGGSQKILTLSKKHNDANVLSIGARFLDEKDLEETITIWLATHFQNEERHLRRIAKIESFCVFNKVFKFLQKFSIF